MNSKPNKTSKATQLRGCLIESLEERRLMSVVFGSNLVQNPGAEKFDGTADGFNIITPAQWTANGDPTVARYRRGYGPSIGIRKPDNGGDAFFTGGPDSESTDLFQTIDLTSIAAQIDSGQVNFNLSAELGGYAFADDNAEVYVNFKDASTANLSRVGSGSVSASDRNDATKLIERSQAGTVPATARLAQVQIHFKRDGLGSYNDGFADNVSLVLVTNTASTSGITPVVTRSTLPAAAVSGIKTSGVLVLTLTNTSSSINKGLGTISLFASSNSVVDSSSILVRTLKYHFSFGAGKIVRLAFPVKNLQLPSGSYTIFAQTTDAYDTVVTAATGPTLVVAAPFVSLSTTVGPVLPATVKPGAVISFTLTIQNAGNVNSTGLASVAIGLSSDGITLTAPLVTLLRRLTIRPTNRPVPMRIRVKVPVGLSGAFYPFVTFNQGSASATTIGSSPVTVIA